MTRQKLTKTLVLAALLLLVFSLPWILGLFKGPVYWRDVFIRIAIFILATSSMRAIYLTGEVSLGTSGFMLLGGYSSALIAAKLGLSPWLAMLIGGLFAAAVAAAVGYPFFRIKGVYFVITTLLLAFVFLYLAGWLQGLTGGWQGFRFFEISPQLAVGSLTIAFTTKTNIEYYYLTMIVVGVCLFVLYRMERSRIGLVWGSIREADNLAQSVGVNIMAQKVFIFVVACFFTGLAGALFAFHVHALSPTSTPANVFHFFTSVYCLMYMVVGGEASFFGPIIGTTLFMLLRELSRGLEEYWPLVAGAFLILIIFFMPQGLIGVGDYVATGYKKLFGRVPKKALSGKR
jgi:branched-chain amino acid transport system permease protein